MEYFICLYGNTSFLLIAMIDFVFGLFLLGVQSCSSSIDVPTQLSYTQDPIHLSISCPISFVMVMIKFSSFRLFDILKHNNFAQIRAVFSLEEKSLLLFWAEQFDFYYFFQIKQIVNLIFCCLCLKYFCWIPQHAFTSGATKLYLGNQGTDSNLRFFVIFN